MGEAQPTEAKVQFKSIKKRPQRRRSRGDSEEEEEPEFNKEKYEETRELQKLRKRAAGTNVLTLACGKKISRVEEAIANDPFKLNSGGLVDMKNMKGYTQKENPYEVGTQFSKETHIRDEDDEMRKFIETEMEKLKGQKVDDDQSEPQYLSPEDAALLSLPEHLRKSTFKKDQQMLSAQMLSGIPEVDLGIEAKIMNIERTEKAKRKLLEEAKRSGSGAAEGITANPSNMYVQHDRFKLDTPKVKARDKEKPVAATGSSRPNTVLINQETEEAAIRALQERAGDDAALERFKKANEKKKK